MLFSLLLSRKLFIVISKVKSTRFKYFHNKTMKARILLKHPMTELNVGGWNEIEWRIKWSEYALGENKTDPGIMTSLGWVRLLVNDVTVVDEKLPVGNNAQGRVPYFKLGQIDFFVNDFVRHVLHSNGYSIICAVKFRNLRRKLAC